MALGIGTEYLSTGGADGVMVNRSDENLGLFGKTPSAIKANIAAVATSTVTTAATTTTPWGFATSTQADALTAIVADLRTKFNTLKTDLQSFTHAAS